MLHEEGASTDSTGTLVLSSAVITFLKGSRTSPEKLNPENEYQYGTLKTWYDHRTEDSIHNMISGTQ